MGLPPVAGTTISYARDPMQGVAGMHQPKPSMAKDSADDDFVDLESLCKATRFMGLPGGLGGRVCRREHDLDDAKVE